MSPIEAPFLIKRILAQTIVHLNDRLRPIHRVLIRAFLVRQQVGCDAVPVKLLPY